MKGWAFPPAADADRLPRTWRADLSRLVGPLWWAGFAFAVAAAAWPTSRGEGDAEPAEGVVLVLAVDRSGSMRKADAGGRPRMEAVAGVAAEFLTGRSELLTEGRLAAATAREGDRVGLVTFAAAARTEVPPTLDHDLVAGRLAAVQTARGVREDGTAIGDAVALAVARAEDAAAATPGVGRAVLLLTDGQHNAGRLSPAAAAEAAAAKGVRVDVVSVRPGDAPTAVWEASDRQLRSLAERTGGRWFRAGDAESLRAVTAEVDALQRREVARRTPSAGTSIAVDGRLPLAAVAAALLAAAVVLRDGVCRRAGGGP